MSVMTHAPTPSTPALATNVPLTDLTPEQLRLVDDTLWHLGIEDGHTTNNGGIPVIDLRRMYSATTAAAIGLHLPARAELAQCHDCRTVTSTDQVTECADGAWRCTTTSDGTPCAARYLDEQ